MGKGKLIVIEGAVDGIGKSTQYKLLKDYLEQTGNVYTHHFPSYNTFQGMPVEKYLSGDFGDIKDLSPYFINNLYASDRVITWNLELKDKYENGNTILLDRYTTSSLIYQTAFMEKDEKIKFIDFVTNYEYNLLGLPKPDKVIFLKGDYDIVKKMRMAREGYEGNENDIHEKNEEYLKKVYNNSLFVADYLNFDIIDVCENNKMKSINEIQNSIRKKL